MKERHDGGIACTEVLECLSSFADGELEQSVRRRIADHFDGCDNCRRFGTEFAGMVRSAADTHSPLSEALIARLTSALDETPPAD